MTINLLLFAVNFKICLRNEFDFTFYVWYRSKEIFPNVNWGAIGDVVVVTRVEGNTRISLDDNENPLSTSSKFSDKDVSQFQSIRSRGTLPMKCQCQ